jgi:NADPH:quinone reductase-like Zn-dependent oxidoreductase
VVLRVRYQRNGGPEVLFTEHVPEPTPGAGELVVRAEAIGVTLPAVRKVREAREPAPLGGEVAGEVVALGVGVDGFALGDRVIGLCLGHGYADYAVLGAVMTAPIPEGVTPVDAVALLRSGLVALGTFHAAGAQPGESVLVTAAASGVGHLAVQLARVRGASRVVGAVSSPGKIGFVRSLGADDVVIYNQPNWGDPVDYILDGVGGDLLGPAVAALDAGGRLIAYSSGGGTIDAHDLLVGSKTVTGFQMARIAFGQPDLYESWRQELWTLFRAGRIRPTVHATFALTDASAAHAVIEAHANQGKVVLVP